MKLTLKAPNDYGPVEDLAFTLYAMSIEAEAEEEFEEDEEEDGLL